MTSVLLLLAFIALVSRVHFASFLEGPAALAIGQDLQSIQNYVDNFGAPSEFAVMGYVSLANLTGLLKPTDYGSGIEFVEGIMTAHPSADLQLGLYLVDLLEDTSNGVLDKEIDRLGSFIASKAPRRVLVRVGYECDGPQNHHDPETYKTAFRRVAHGLRRKAPDNVEIVWHSWARVQEMNFGGLETISWWPGPDVVDWVGVSLFGQVYGGSDGLRPAAVIAQFAANQSKPLLIGESTPLGLGINPSVTVDNVWELWFAPVLAFVTEHSVRLWSYINADWNAQPMWAGEGWGDSRIQQTNALEERWRNEVLQSPYFGEAELSLGMVFTGSYRVKLLLYLGCALTLVLVVTGTLSAKAGQRASLYDGHALNLPLVTHKLPLRADHDYGSLRPQESTDPRSSFAE